MKCEQTFPVYSTTPKKCRLLEEYQGRYTSSPMVHQSSSGYSGRKSNAGRPVHGQAFYCLSYPGSR